MILIPNQLADSFRKVINHSRQGLCWACPRIHGSGGLGTDTSEKGTRLNIHHTTLKSIKDKSFLIQIKNWEETRPTEDVLLEEEEDKYKTSKQQTLEPRAWQAA